VATAFAPASVGNAAVGFDILGHALAGAGDRVVARRSARSGVRVLAIRGATVELPREAERNTAGKALLSLFAARQADFGVEIEIEKGIALGSGMGGSAASAVAALVAANELFEQPLSRDELYAHALEGEAVASGGKHGDNIAPMLLGGLVLATHERMIKVPVPRGLWCALAHPHFVLETRVARAALVEPYAIGDFVRQSERLALVLAGCWRDDLSLVRAAHPGVRGGEAGGTLLRGARREHQRSWTERLRLVRRRNDSTPRRGGHASGLRRGRTRQ
jgi:homoserine kinase